MRELVLARCGQQREVMCPITTMLDLLVPYRVGQHFEQRNRVPMSWFVSDRPVQPFTLYCLDAGDDDRYWCRGHIQQTMANDANFRVATDLQGS